MWPNLELYRYGLRAPEGAAAGGAGGAPGGAPPAGGAPATGGTAPPGGAPPPAGGAWYASAGLDADGVGFLESKKFDGLPSLVKSAIHTERMARERNVIGKPDPAKLADWEGWGELGYDSDLTRYTGKVAKPELKNGHVLNDGFWDGMMKAGHAAKVPPAQLQALAHYAIQWGNEQAEANTTRVQGEVAAAEEALRKEWGNDYESKRAIAKRAFQAIGIGVSDAAHLDRALGAPGLVKAFARLGELLGEEQLPGASGGTTGFGRSPSTITAELKKFETDNIKTIRDRRDPNYDAVMARRQNLIDELERANRGRS